MLTKDPILRKKSFSFAVHVVRLYRTLVEEKKEYVLSKQLLKAGTSIGANVSEANGAISTSDFSAKMSIAYKESLETKYWLELLKESKYLGEKEFVQLYEFADELSRILYSILKTTRINRKSGSK